MEIWKSKLTVEELAEKSKGTIMDCIGMEYLEIGDDFVKGRIPVDERTRQLFGRIHGGASVVLAETLGSVAAGMCVDKSHTVVGLEINANHIRGVFKGWVTGIAEPLHIGGSTQIWSIKMYNDAGKLSCVSRLTTMTISKDAGGAR